MRFTLPGRDLPDIEQHSFIRIGVTNLQPGFGIQHSDAQFFVQFPLKCSDHGLPFFHLAARKFPQTALMHMVGSAGDQHCAVGVDEDAHRDMNDVHVRYSALMRT